MPNKFFMGGSYDEVVENVVQSFTRESLRGLSYTEDFGLGVGGNDFAPAGAEDGVVGFVDDDEVGRVISNAPPSGESEDTSHCNISNIVLISACAKAMGTICSAERLRNLLDEFCSVSEDNDSSPAGSCARTYVTEKDGFPTTTRRLVENGPLTPRERLPDMPNVSLLIVA